MRGKKRDWLGVMLVILAGCGSDDDDDALSTGGAVGASGGNAAGGRAGGQTGGSSGGGTGGSSSAGDAGASLAGSASGGSSGAGGNGGAVSTGGGETTTGGTAGATGGATGGGGMGGAVPTSGAGGATGGTTGGGGTGGTSPAGGTGGTSPTGGTGGATGGGGTGGTVASGGTGGATGGAAGSGGSSETGGTGGTGAEDGYLLEGVNGRIEVVVYSDVSGWSPTALVGAQLYTGPLRLDAFAPYAAGLHEVSLAEGDCTLLAAATLACDPACDFEQYCGPGNVCVTTPLAADAGDITVAGSSGETTLVFGTTYSQGELAATSVAGAVTATAAGGTMPGFVLTTAGVTAPVFDLPDDGTLTLQDGSDYVITWDPVTTGTVQLLLNSGWHGAPPVATLICEVPASSGELVIPQAIVEAYPAAGGIGLFPHSSYLSLFDRARVTVDGGVVELVVGYRQGVTPIH